MKAEVGNSHLLSRFDDKIIGTLRSKTGEVFSVRAITSQESAVRNIESLEMLVPIVNETRKRFKENLSSKRGIPIESILLERPNDNDPKLVFDAEKIKKGAEELVLSFNDNNYTALIVEDRSGKAVSAISFTLNDEKKRRDLNSLNSKRKMLKFFATTLSLFSLSFSALADEENYTMKSKPKANFATIKQHCYVDVSNEDIENLKKKGEESFYIAADDHNFYNSNAMEAAEKEKIKSCFYEQEQPRYLVFILDNGKEIYVDSKPLFWKWILFNGKEIKVVYPIDVEQKILKDFYKKK